MHSLSLVRRVAAHAARAMCITALAAGAWPALAAPEAVPTVRIGEQEWMRDNLAVKHFRNGEGIPTFAEASEWAKAGRQRIPAWVAYAGDSANAVRYGLLYNHYAVTDPRGICPAGFKVPSTQDWAELESTLTAGRAAKRLKTATGWADDGNGVDDVGFGGLPGGFRTQDGVYFLESKVGYWWTEDGREFTAPTSIAILLFDYSDRIFRIEYPQAIGQSVRCLRER